MNLVYAAYAIAIAREGSISKASESLLVAQPNLSRAVREIEAELGIPIFKRTHSGMLPTPEGARYLAAAQSILQQVDQLEDSMRTAVSAKPSFSISVPRAGYIFSAFTAFSRSDAFGGISNVHYIETDNATTIRHILSDKFNLGIIRYNEVHDISYRLLLEEKELTYTPAARFRYSLVVSKASPLATLPAVRIRDLKSLTEILHPDEFSPAHSPIPVLRDMIGTSTDRRIYLFERAAQLELLHDDPMTFLWSCPIPPRTLQALSLVQLPCKDATDCHMDVLITRRDYQLTEPEQLFIHELKHVCSSIFDDVPAK